jgi:hypothetical protein
MSHLFKRHHVITTSKTNSSGGAIPRMFRYKGGSVEEVKEKRDPRTGKIVHIHGGDIGEVYRSILEPVARVARKHRNRFSLSDVPFALSKALEGKGLVRMM